MQGVLWYDDSGKPLERKVRDASRRYEKKFGRKPNTCYVHPSTLKGVEQPLVVDYCVVYPSPSTLLHHFFVGIVETGKES